MNNRVATIYILAAAAAGFLAGAWTVEGSAAVAIPGVLVVVAWLVFDCAANIRERMSYYRRKL